MKKQLLILAVVAVAGLGAEARAESEAMKCDTRLREVAMKLLDEKASGAMDERVEMLELAITAYYRCEDSEGKDTMAKTLFDQIFNSAEKM